MATRGTRALVSLSAVIAVDQVHGYAFVIFAPEIARRLDLSTNGLATVGLARGMGFVAVAAAVGALVQRGHARRVTQAGAAVRAGALIVGGVAATAPVLGALTIYGATGASGANAHRRLLLAGDHETHRLAGRLGNVAIALLLGALAYWLAWPAVFVAVALLAGAVALTTVFVGRTDHGDDGLDAPVHRFAALPGGRVALGAIAVAALVEFPMYVVVFTHLGRVLHMSVMGRALLIAVAEAAGVVANVLLSRRLNAARAQSTQSLGLGLVTAVAIGFGAVVVAMTVNTVTAAVAALCVATIATSVTVPLLVLGTRAVVADAVPRRVSFVTTGVLAVGLLAAPTNDVVVMAMLAFVPVTAVIAIAAVALRSPEAVAAALSGVANVTPGERMLPGGTALNEA